MKTHKIKIRPDYFDAILSGQKTFEVRYNDREYKTGDTVALMEFNAMTNVYTGRIIYRRIGFLTTYGLDLGYCAFSLLPVDEI